MMVSPQHTSTNIVLKAGLKVKLKLIQPHIKCSGRGDVTCFYRGKIIDVSHGLMPIVRIAFKYKGEKIEEDWDVINECWIEDDDHDPSLYEQIKDIKLISNEK